MAKLAYSIPEAADACGVTVATIEHAIRRGELTAIKRGKRWIINRVQLERWVGLCPTLSSENQAGESV